MLDHFPLAHGGQYLYVDNGLKSICYSVNLHGGGLQQEPGPANGHREEGPDQQHHHEHDLLDSSAAK